MNVNARKVHRTVVGFGIACAVAAALPCVAGEAPPVTDTVSVEAKQMPPEQVKKTGKSAPAEENIGFISGLVIGAVTGGPIGAVAGGITGALMGEHYHKQKALNKALAADLSGSNAERAKLTQTVLQLDGSMDHARDLTLNIAFRTGDAKLTPDDIDQLTTLGRLASGMADIKIKVSGHADPRGAKEYNTALSKERAESVATVLANAGMNPERIVIEALGADGDGAPRDLDTYAFQRRVSVKLMPEAAQVQSKASASTVAQAQ
jgi:outer membrane protein OmpA-like peptidoglycan-associated protein